MTLIGSFFARNTEQPSAVSQTGFDEDAWLQDRFALRPDHVTRSDIPQGQSSISLTQFVAKGKPFMIRKRVRNKRKDEIAFMGGLSRPHDITRRALQLDWPLPHVFHLAQTAAHTDIYMQYVDGVGYRAPAVANGLVRSLTTAIFSLSLILPVICRNGDVTLERRGHPGGRFLAAVEMLVPGSEARLRDVVRLQRHLPLIASHNDIFWPNMGIVSQEDKAQVTFIDFGMLGLNVVGAELHHFARVSVRSKSRTVLFRRICRHYAQLTRMDPAVIEMNAMFYALMRLTAYDLEGNQERVARLCAETLERYEALTAG